MVLQSRGRLSRRTVLAALPAGAVAATATRVAGAQPAAADPMSFYLGQVLALATLQAQAVGRLRPLLAAPNTGDTAWQAGASAEAGVIGAVASVLGAMEPPPELTASVGELRQAAAAYSTAADAARIAAAGDDSALPTAGVGLAEGAAHVLLWLDALTAETGNDWGDGLRTLTAGVTPVPLEETPAEPVPAEPVAEEPPPAEAAPEQPAADETTNKEQGGKGKNKKNKKDQEDGAA